MGGKYNIGIVTLLFIFIVLVTALVLEKLTRFLISMVNCELPEISTTQ